MECYVSADKIDKTMVVDERIASWQPNLTCAATTKYCHAVHLGLLMCDVRANSCRTRSRANQSNGVGSYYNCITCYRPLSAAAPYA